MRPGRVARTVAALFAFALVAAAVSSAEASAPHRALLLQGADAVKGLPFFPPNAIAALSGVYSLDRPASPGAAAASPGDAAAPPASKAGSSVAVWYTRETLVFAPAWKRVDLGGLPGDVAYSLAEGTGIVLALKAGTYVLFFELSSGDPSFAAFAKAFERKFQAFFENAASDAELSFPAYVDY
jgi:hypothetical protein